MKKQALASHLDVSLDEIVESSFSDCIFEAGAMEFLVLNEDEKHEALEEEIAQTLWAFNPSFLSRLTDLPEVIFENLKEESANEAVLALVQKTCGLQAVIDAAIYADGAGHFLAYYDGIEIELDHDLFAYRRN